MPKPPVKKSLDVDQLVLDAGTQSRVEISEETVEDYVEVLAKANSSRWPFKEPLDVFADGKRYLVADGFHRALASRRHGREKVPCRVHQGTAKDALRFGMTANETHGLRRSREDKHYNVELLLDGDEQLTQAQIAEIAGVGERTVQRIVAERRRQNPPLAGSDDPFIDDDDPFAAAGNDDSDDQELPPPPSRDSDDAEAAGDEPEKRSPAEEFRLQRSKAVKTAEALSRAIDDLNDLRKKPNKCTALKQRVYDLIDEVKAW